MRARGWLLLPTLALVAWLCLHDWRTSHAADGPSEAPTEPQPTNPATRLAQPPAAALASPATAPAQRTAASTPPVVVDTSPRPCALRVVDASNDTPIADLQLRLQVFAGKQSDWLHLRTDRDGIARFTVEPHLLVGGYGYGAEVALEEFAAAIVARPERFDDLTATPPPTLRIQRGTVRDVSVSDEQGAPVNGAVLTGHPMRAAVTDARGMARACLDWPSQTWVEVCAPGFRQQLAHVPPEGQRWHIVLHRSHRLEFALLGDAPEGYHLELGLPESFAQRQFYQSRVVQTPGRPVDGTKGEWSSRGRHASHWTLGFRADGLATLDQLDDDGTIALALYRFDELVCRRELTLSPPRGLQRVELQGAPPREAVTVTVVDTAGRPLHQVDVHVAPTARAMISPARDGFPCWAPGARTDVRGQCTLPHPASDDTLLVALGGQLAVTVKSWREVVATELRITMEKGRDAKIEVRGRDGQELIEGETTGYRARVIPFIVLPHGLRLGPSEESTPSFWFQGVPLGAVELGFTYLPDVRMHHALPEHHVRIDLDTSVEELMLGK